MKKQMGFSTNRLVRGIQMQKIISILLSIFIAVSTMFGFVACSGERYAVPPTVSSWDGKSATIEWYNANTEANEFTLNSASDLAGLAALVNGTGITESTGFLTPVDFTGKTIKLNIDIDLKNNHWIPIGQKAGGTDDSPLNFSGTFDGNGHKVENLFISGENLDPKFDGYVALFGAANGTIKNLTVSGEVQGENAAGIVARANAKCVIENCVSNVNVTGTTEGKAGGIVCLTNPTSETDNVIIKCCVNNGTIKTGNSGLGGIAGYVNKYTIIENCTNNGNIGSVSDKYAGGIAGYVTGINPSIKYCENTGIISAAVNAGGIVSIITGSSENTIIENCTNEGEIKGSDSSAAGGILGSINTSSSLISCMNTAPVHGKFAGGVVGIAGGNNNIINNCNGGTEAITSPSFTLDFNGQSFTLDINENEAVGRVLGANGGSGPSDWTKIIVADGDGYENIGTVGICGIYTTWANLEIVGGIFHGNPLAGNTAYILFTDGTWEGKTKGTKYICGGFSNRIDEWVAANS